MEYKSSFKLGEDFKADGVHVIIQTRRGLLSRLSTSHHSNSARTLKPMEYKSSFKLGKDFKVGGVQVIIQTRRGL
ncbi:hypothetical protein DPMN_122056 [Dreissena polymorpha]|uniref:Uncharacterized protein n=1 Tax=Dreissena polymorpha TaxID=45954 RepID=A0A9D4JQ17_DREPO|nr:hypothetical protein DPMN_122056 [Dreissena polymorpha]